jgi:DNA/RNA-binding domain of Phe-tRNA-synthetase-like protein
METVIRVDPDLAAVVSPAAGTTGTITVVDREPRLDAPLAEAASRLRTAEPPADLTAAVRSMYKAVGIDPTKTRPSSEALLRRVRRGDPLPRVNSLVDVVNWTSVETQLPFGVYDVGHVRGAIVLRLGREGESYPGIRKDEVHLTGRLALFDDEGPFGNPTSDSARTMVTTATRDALIVVFAPAALREAGRRALALALERAGEYCRPQL